MRNTFSQWQLTVLVMMAGMCGMFFYPRGFGRWSGALLAGGVLIALLSMALLAKCFAGSRALSFPSLLAEHLGTVPARVILGAAAVYGGRRPP